MNINFREIINRIKDKTGMLQKEIADQLYDISDKNLSGRIKSNRIPFRRTIDWAIQNNIDLEWLLTGKGPMVRKNDDYEPDWPEIEYNHAESGDNSDQPHKKRRLADRLGKPDTREGILELFSDRQAARRINLTMLKIEKKNPNCLTKIEGYIQGIEGMLTDEPEKK